MPSARHLDEAKMNEAKDKSLCIGSFRVVRRGRFWRVMEADGQLIVTAVYRKGALEVVRRLLPPDLRPLVDVCPKRTAPRPQRVRQSANHYDPHQR